MKRTTDEIRFLLLKKLDEKGRINIELIRKELKTGLPTVLYNAEDLEIMGFLKLHETNVGKRKYRELEITDDGKFFLEKLKRIFKKNEFL